MLLIFHHVVAGRSGAEADFRVNGDVRDAIQCLKFDGVKTALICTQGAPLAHDSLKDLEIAQVCLPHIPSTRSQLIQPNNNNNPAIFFCSEERHCVFISACFFFPLLLPEMPTSFSEGQFDGFPPRQHFNAAITPGGSSGVASEELSGLLARLGDFPSERCIYVGTSGLETATKLGMMAIKWTGDQGDVVRALEAACETSLVRTCPMTRLLHRPLRMLPAPTILFALPTLHVATLVWCAVVM